MMTSTDLSATNEIAETTSFTDTQTMVASDDTICNNTLIGQIKTFNSYYIPLLVFAGLTGNTLSILVFRSTKLKNIPASYYLGALALVDCGVLFIDLFNLAGGYELITLNGWCQLLFYANNVFCFLSVWFVVSFTTERFVAVRYPLYRLRWCTVERCRTTIAFLVVFAVCWNVYVLVTTQPVVIASGSSDANGTALSTPLIMCTTTEAYMNTVFVFNYLDSALTLLIPFCLIIVLNFAISIKLLYRSPTKSLAQLTVSSTTPFLHEPDNNDSRRHSHNCQEKTDEKITKVLLIVSMVFLVMNLPDHVFRVVASVLYHMEVWFEVEPINICRFLIAQMAANIVFKTNFAVNFFLYNLVGKNFRGHVRYLIRSWLKRVKSIFCLCRKNKSNKTVSRQNSAITTVF